MILTELDKVAESLSETVSSLFLLKSTIMPLMSGHDRSNFNSSVFPRNPVAPVRSTIFPW
jgi:hypothetical protein